MSAENQRSSLQILYFLYFVVLLWAYVEYIPTYFEYEGYFRRLDPLKVIESVLILSTLVWTISRRITVSAVFLHFGMMLVIIPSLVLYGGGGKDGYFLFVSLTAFVVAIAGASFFKIGTVKLGGLSSAAALRVGVLITYAVIILMASFGGMRYFNLDLTLVYDFRQDAEDNLPGIFSYLIPITTKVIIPIGALLAVRARAWFYLLLYVLSSIVIFGLTSHKGILFYPWIALFVFYAFRFGAAIKVVLLSLIVLIVICGLSLEYAESGVELFVASLFIRRSLLVPAQLNSFYIDWFYDSPFVLWAESKISLGLLRSPYDLSMTNLIGEKYLDSADASANAGWIGSGYANGGLFGVLAYSLAVGLVFAVLRAYGKKLGNEFVIAAFLPLVLTMLMSSDFVAVFLTHGLLVALLILILLSRDKAPQLPSPRSDRQ